MSKLKALEHGVKAAVFNLSRPILKRRRDEFKPIDGNAISKVLFLRPEKIGDMVISFPVFDGIKAAFPHLQVSVLGSPRSYGIIKDDPRFEKIFLYHKNLSAISEMGKMRRERFDCVVDMICDDSVTALYLSQLAAPGKPRVGVGKVKFREYYDFNYDHRMGNTGHIIDNTLKLLEAFGIDSDQVSRYAIPYVPDEDFRRADDFVESLSEREARPTLIGYNLSAGSATRVWPLNRARHLISRILAERGDCQVILFTVGEDRPRAEALASGIEGPVHLVPPGLNLRQAAAVISRLNLMISPDTSLVHIARSFRVPVVGLYTRFMKNFLLWKPYGQEVGAVVSDNDYNIFDIQIDQVYEVFEQVIENGVGVQQ